MTPRMIELLTDAKKQIGNYLVIKNDQMKTYRTDVIDRVVCEIKTNSIVIDFITMNGNQMQSNAYTKVYDSRKAADEACMFLNNRSGGEG